MATSKAIITGGSNGIGLAIARGLLQGDYEVVSLARSIRQGAADALPNLRQIACDIGNHDEVEAVIEQLVSENWCPDVLVNNAGIALGAPDAYWEQSFTDIRQVLNTDIFGVANVTYAVMQKAQIPAGRGTILNISSVTGLEVPVKGMGEVSYHSSKAFLEGFSNTLRNEVIGTDIRVLVLRPGFVRTNFHFDRVGQQQDKFDDVFAGIEPLSADDVAAAALWMLSQPERISVKALDIVPTPQRSLTQCDRDWNARHPTV